MAASTWNNAGTWEDKNVTVPGLELLVEALSGISAEAQGTTVTITPHGAKVTGTVHVLHVRGTPRVGLELNLDLKWQSDGVVTGSAKVEELSETDLEDFDFFITGITGGDKSAQDAAKKAVRELRSTVARTIDNVMIEILKKHS